ncbi:Putative heterokaryon incompatibility [Septoria linicola]|uniref:Heterokaryon incompatibility n=1 Tax=Septoria linicola TaxID=215465 RepID=A0A9Q9AXJ6_9PEZI|nr:putative heterokaryon incompatibility [Septoria linicola]USW52481.1 Putative heterokaryon incompatibility [Septoria linicola]
MSKSVAKYETVSYCWGREPGQCFMEIDGQPELVPGSAVRVLRALRHPTRSRVLWIDAICINQCDQTEKSDQVSFMCEIYRHGYNNLIWLGEAEKRHSIEVEQTLQAVLSNKRRAMENDERFRRLMRSSDSAEVQNGQYLDPGINLAPLQTLFESEWFCRLWVAQEATLAPKSVCNFGDRSVPLADALDVAVWLVYNSSMLPSALKVSRGIHAARAMWYLLDSKDDRSQDLFMAFLLAQNFQATEPRDHVYALLGLYKDQQPHRCLRGLYLRPNYNKPIGDVFRDATRAWIEDSSSLQTLKFVQPTKVIAGSPSWTLMFNVGPSGLDADPLCKLGNGFNADGSLSSPVDFKDSDTLRVLGAPIDHVNQCCPRFTKARSWANGEHARHMSMISSVIEQRREGTDWRPELGFVLTAGSRLESRSSLASDFAAFLNYSARNPTQPPVATTSVRVDKDFARANRWYTKFEQTVYGRRFFMTKRGLAGIGPLDMACNDVILVIRGSSIPLVLRPGRNACEYTLVGPCYVFGLMHGEARECEVSWLSIK